MNNRTKNIILYGVKHCGKTTAGRLLSRQLRRPFLDTDHMVQAAFKQQTGHDWRLREFIKCYGQNAFEQYERRAVRYCARQQGCIIAVGGSTLLRESNLIDLKATGLLIYLPVSPLVSFQRIQQTGLPTFLDPKDPLGSFLEYYRQRVLLYQQLQTSR